MKLAKLILKYTKPTHALPMQIARASKRASANQLAVCFRASHYRVLKPRVLHFIIILSAPLHSHAIAPTVLCHLLQS